MDRGAGARQDSPDPVAAPEPGLAIVGLRAVQFGLDLGAVAVLCFAATSLMALLPQAPDGTIANPLQALLMVLAVLALAIGANYWYWVQWPLAHGGQTFAMIALRLRVVGAGDTPASKAQLALRALVLVADAMFMGLVGLLAMLSGPRRQRLGDMLAGTDVVRVPARSLAVPAPSAGSPARARVRPTDVARVRAEPAPGSR